MAPEPELRHFLAVRKGIMARSLWLGSLLSLMACTSASVETSSAPTEPDGTPSFSPERAALPSDPECPSGQASCDGACVDVASDASRCGSCGHACGAGEACFDGTCAPCPTGSLGEDGLCHAMYDVASTGLVGLGASCGDAVVFNACNGTPFAVRFHDASGRAPRALTVSLSTSIFCAGDGDDTPEKRTQHVYINGSATEIGSFEGRLEDCRCDAAVTERSFEIDGAKLAGYHLRGTNEIVVSGSNRCVGLQANPDWAGAFARVAVRY